MSNSTELFISVCASVCHKEGNLISGHCPRGEIVQLLQWNIDYPESVVLKYLVGTIKSSDI